MAPPKPSVQTQFILEAMASSDERDSSRFDQVLESLDLLFVKVGQLDTTQQRMATQMDLGNQVMEHMLKDQQSLATQMEVAGKLLLGYLPQISTCRTVRFLRLLQVMFQPTALFRVHLGLGVIIRVLDMLSLRCRFPNLLV